MSSALSRSLNPVDVANLMAEHLARAVGADQAQISDWDRADGRVRTLGCYPPELRETLDDVLPARGLSRRRSRVLEEGGISVIDAEDPDRGRGRGRAPARATGCAAS